MPIDKYDFSSHQINFFFQYQTKATTKIFNGQNAETKRPWGTWAQGTSWTQGRKPVKPKEQETFWWAVPSRHDSKQYP